MNRSRQHDSQDGWSAGARVAAWLLGLAALAIWGWWIPFVVGFDVRPMTRHAIRDERPGETIYFRSCATARAAGAAPVRATDPGYRPALDSDNDGIACE